MTNRYVYEARTLAGPRTSVTNRQVVRDFGKSMFFNSTDYVDTPVIPSATAWSFAFWIKFLPDAAWDKIIGCNGTSSVGGFHLQNTVANKPTLNLSVFEDGTERYGTAFPVKAGEWMHIVGTYATGTKASIYVNGVLKFQTTAAVVMTVPDKAITLMATPFHNGNTTGYMDEFVFDNGVTWDQATIENLYYRGMIPSTADCVYNFNDQVLDQTANGNNGTNSNGTYSTDVKMVARRVV